jgi:hypothetical protein
MAARWILGAVAGLAGVCAASTALADCSISITPQNGTSFGKIVANTTVNGAQSSAIPTSFTIPVGGGIVTQNPAAGTLGAAILLSPKSNFQWQVTIISGPACSGSVTSSLTATSTSTPAFTFSGTPFSLTPVSGITSLSSTQVANGGSFTVNFSQGGNGRTAIFNVGTVLSLPAARQSGSISWSTKATAQ